MHDQFAAGEELGEREAVMLRGLREYVHESLLELAGRGRRLEDVQPTLHRVHHQISEGSADVDARSKHVNSRYDFSKHRA